MLKNLTTNLTFWVLLGGLLGYFSALWLGDPVWLEAGELPAFYELVLLMKSSFLALLKMLIAPIIFFSLIGGLLSIGDASRLKSLGGITVVYYLTTTAIAITIGLSVVLFVHPWVGNVEQITVATLTNDPYYICLLYTSPSPRD